MDLYLNSIDNYYNDNTLRYYFKKPITFDDNHVHLEKMIYYNFFTNINQEETIKIVFEDDDEDAIIIKLPYPTSLEITDINSIIKENLIQSNIINDSDDSLINIISDVNRYKILIILDDKIKNIELSDNLKILLGFNDNILSDRINLSNKIPRVDSVIHLKLYCNIVKNENFPELLSIIDIDGGLSSKCVYKNNNFNKKIKTINSSFDYIEIKILDQHDNPVKMTDYYSINLYIDKN